MTDWTPRLSQSLRSAPLTPREQEVADLVQLGLTRQQIGDKLGISPNTVKEHKRHIYRKLGVKNSVQLLRKRADPFRADVLRGERSPFAGEWELLAEMDE